MNRELKLDKGKIADILSLTPMQEGMLVHYLKYPERDLYFEQLCLSISGKIDINIFAKAWEFVVENNGMLRTLFRWQRVKHPTQVVLKQHHLDIRYYDFTGSMDKALAESGVLTGRNFGKHTGTGENEALLAVIKTRDRQEKFDLRQVPFRVTLCKLAQNNYEMIISNHHILYDGWSNGIILKESFSAYHNLLHGKTPKKPVKSKFREYIRWLREQDSGSQEKFWEKYLAGFDKSTELSVKKPGGTEITYVGNFKEQLGKDFRVKLEDFIKENRITPASLFYSAYAILLQKYNNVADVIFGTTVSGRSAKIQGIEDIVGLFINTIPLRVKTGSPGKEKVIDIIKRVNDDLQVREAYEATPLVDIKEYSLLDSGEKLLDSIFVIENYPLNTFLDGGMGELTVDSYSIFEMTNYDLTVTLSLTGEIDINFIYNCACFEHEVIERLFNHFKNILEEILENSSKELSAISILSMEERRQLLIDFNDTAATYPGEKQIHELFENQVGKTPDRIALVGAKHSAPRQKGNASPLQSICLTYCALDNRADRLARLLIEKGVRRNTVTGIKIERSIEMVLGILAILKAGGAYMPISPAYPEARQRYILRDSGAALLLTGRGFSGEMEKFRNLEVETVFIEECRDEPCVHPSNTVVGARRAVPSAPAACNLKPVTSTLNLAYIIYTSGSTGNPKGVVVEHKAVVNIITTLQKEYPLKPSDTYLLKTSYVFDVSVAELFGWFPGGGRLAVLEKEGEKDPQKIITAIYRESITHINFVPSMFNLFVDELNSRNLKKVSALKYIFVAGEAFLPGLVKKFTSLHTNIILENIYGPTEGTVYSSKYSLSGWNDKGSVPIGKPMQNINLFVLDKDDNLLPIGVPGELSISGDNIAPGYLNQPELTAEKFVRTVISHSSLVISSSKLSPNDQCPMTNDLLYKTGDLARWLSDGNIEFLGRMDSQVKIRGFRVELGEIESRLLKHEKIREAVVTAYDDGRGDKYLCAYIAAQDLDNGLQGEGVECVQPGLRRLYAVTGEEERTNSLAAAELRDYLSAALPHYMVPSYYLFIKELPLTATGKIDRKMLPVPLAKPQSEYVLPRDETEKKLAEIWSELLSGLPEKAGQVLPGIDDNFFDCGGHSLKAARLLSRVHKEFDVEITLGEIFKIPTIRGLSGYIKETGRSKYRPIKPTEKKEYYPLSPAQKRLYVLQQMEEKSRVYNMPGIIKVAGKITKESFEHVFAKLIERHESLRTSFNVINEEPVQKISKFGEIEFKIDFHKNQPLQTENNEKLLSNFFQPRGAGSHRGLFNSGERVINNQEHALVNKFIRTFDLSHAPLLRVGLLELDQEMHILIADMHHIISDGASLGIFMREFISLYKEEELPPLHFQYKDYPEWLLSEQGKKIRQKQEKYWLEELSGEIPVLHLPTDFPRPAARSFAGSQVVFEIGEEETAALKSLALKENVTLYMLLFALFNIYLSRLTGQEDIIIGTAAEGRRHTELENIIGMFVNTLPLRNYPGGEKTFTTFLKEVKERTTASFENQEYPFEELVDRVVVNREAGRNPLFDVMFVLDDMDFSRELSPGLRLTTLEYGNITQVAKFDLTLTARVSGPNFSFNLEYCTKLFKKATIERFCTYFKQVISSIIENPGVNTALIEIMPAEEKRRILYDFNDTKTDYPRDKTIQQCFAEQAERSPDHLATTGTCFRIPSSPVSLSYKELNEKADRLESALSRRGVGIEENVGIMVERSLEMVIGILAILKVNAAYLPIDVDYPGERKRYMLNDSRAGLLLTTRNLKNKVMGLEGWQGETVFLDAFDAPAAARPPAAAPSNLAYIIYTSGSTGTPRGVLVEHYNVIRLVKNTNYVRFSRDIRILQTGALEFDASTFEIWGSLLNGSPLYLVDKETILNPEKLHRAMKKYAINTIWMTSALFNRMQLAETEIFSGLTNLLVGGDVLYPLFINRVKVRFPGVNIINGYGPTENTTFSTTYRVAKTFTENIPIGKPIANSTAFIVSPYGHLQPIGIVGELCVGGDGVSRGYMNNPELTAEKFVRTVISHSSLVIRHSSLVISSSKLSPSDQCPMTNDLLYKTGDLTRWLPDGNIEFLGRIDHQVKIRGFRVELAEIESRLLSHKNIEDAVVLALDSEPGEKNLCAYIVGARRAVPSDFNVAEIREYLSQTLPGYMIPVYFAELEKIPLTPNGKVDRKALSTSGIRLSAPVEYAAPRTGLEKQLADIWCEVLSGRETSPAGVIGIDDNFFELGGHSLKASILTAKVHEKLNVKIPLKELFISPTIRGLTGYIQKTTADEFVSLKIAEDKEYYSLSSAQKRLYILQQLDEKNMTYNLPQVMVLEGFPEKDRLQEVFCRLIDRHESFRSSFLPLAGETVQKIHPAGEIEFGIEYYEAGGSLEVPEIRAKQDRKESGVGAQCAVPLEPESRNQLPESVAGIIGQFIRPFDLSRAPLLRAGLVKMVAVSDSDLHLLLFDMHHIISDGTSMKTLVNDFMALYAGKELAPLKLQYKDFSAWQSSDEWQETVKEQEEYWLKQFAKEVPVMELLYDYPRPGKQSFAGSILEFEIDRETTADLKQLAKEEEVTLFMVLLAIYNILLSKLSWQEDIVVGTPVHGRSSGEFQSIIGMFAATVSLRNHPSAGMSFRSFLKEVKVRTLTAFENQDYPFENLVEKVAAGRESAHKPLFDTMFTLQNIGIPEVEIPGLKLRPYKKYRHPFSRFDLTWIGEEMEDALLFKVEYCTALFKEERVKGFGDYFIEIIAAVLSDRDICINDIELTPGLSDSQTTIKEEASGEFGI